MGTTSRTQNLDALRHIFENLTRDEDGQTVAPDVYEARLKKVFGVVFTGHPTFSMAEDKSSAMARHFTHLAGSESYGSDTEERLARQLRAPYEKPTLDGEVSQAHGAIKNVHGAINLIEKLASTSEKMQEHHNFYKSYDPEQDPDLKELARWSKKLAS